MKQKLQSFMHLRARWLIVVGLLMLSLSSFAGTNMTYVDIIDPSKAEVTYEPSNGRVKITFVYYYNPTNSAKDVSLRNSTISVTGNNTTIQIATLNGESDAEWVNMTNGACDAQKGYVVPIKTGQPTTTYTFADNVEDGNSAKATFYYYPPERLLGANISFDFDFKIEQDQDGEGLISRTATKTVSERLPNVTAQALSSNVNFSSTLNKMDVSVTYSGSLPDNLYWGEGKTGTEFEVSTMTKQYDRSNNEQTLTIPIELRFSTYVTKPINVKRVINGYQSISNFKAVYDSAGTVNLSWDLENGTGERYKNDYFAIERATTDDFRDATQIASVGVNVGSKSYSHVDNLISADVFSPTFYYRITRTTTKEVSGWGWNFGENLNIKPPYKHISILSAAAELHTGTSDTIHVTWTHNGASNLWTTGSEFIIIRENLTAGTRQQITGLTKEDLERGYYDDRAVQQCNSYMYTVYVSPGNSSFARNQFTTDRLTPTTMGSIISADASKGYYADRTQIEWISQGTFDEFVISRKVHGADESTWQNIKTVSGASVTAQYQEADATGLAGKVYDYRVIGALKCSDSLLYSNPVYAYGFRTPTGDFYGRVTFENGQGEDSVLVRLQSDATLPGYSLQFNGTGSAVVADSSLMRSTVQNFSVQAWVNPSNTTQTASFVKKEGMFDLGMENGMFYFTVNGTTLPYNVSIIDSLKKSSDFMHLTGIYDKGVMTLYVNGANPVQGTCSASPLGNTNRVTMGANYTGILDEVRLWSKALPLQSVEADYIRYLVGNESGLEAYYTFNYVVEGEFYDMAYTDADYHEYHGTCSSGVVVSETIPTTSQLGYCGITSSDGAYAIRSVPYVGNGTAFTIIPSRGIHTFTPVYEIRFIGGATTSHTVNFTDNSSFNVGGYVTYSGGNYPVENAYFTVDGVTVLNSNGTYVYSGSDGRFDISVPVGTHEVRVMKQGHTFERDGYLLTLEGTNRNYQDRIEGVEFKDLTRVKYVGRVSGGTIQEAYPVGHSMSTNNLASGITVRLAHKHIGSYKLSENVVETLQPHFTSAHQTVQHFNKVTYTDDYIEIGVNDSTGEFVAYVIPELYGVTVTARGHSNIPGSASDVNFTESVLVDTLYSTATYVDSIETDNGKIAAAVTDTIYFNKQQIFSKRYSPIVYMAQLNDRNNRLPYFGLDSVTTLLMNGSTYRIPLYNALTNTYTFGKPVFDMSTYNLFIKVCEVYDYYSSNNTITRSDSVPTTDATILFNNSMASAQDAISVDSIDGTALYSFHVENLNLSTAVSNIAATISYGSEPVTTIPWNQPFTNGEVYTLGMNLTGTNFVTSGPEKVLTVLRDPPGSNSYAYLEKGVTFDESSTYTGSLEETGFEGAVISVGTEVKTFSGVGTGVIAESTAITTDEIGGVHTEQYQGSDTKNSSTTLTSRYQTSDDPAYVGADADVYIGYSTNITFGATENVVVVPMSLFNQVGGALHYENVYAQTSEYAMVKEKGTNVAEKFSTFFAYPQVHIEQVLIPQLESIRQEQLLVNQTQAQIDSMLNIVATNKDTAFYVSYWPLGDENFGKLNSDESLSAYKSVYGVDTLSYNGPSYYMICNKDYEKSDTVGLITQWISNWKYQMGLNEYLKAMSIKEDKKSLVQNYSFHAASPIEYSESYATGKAHESTFYISIGARWTHSTDFDYSAGSKSRFYFALEEEVTTTQGGTFTSSTESSHSKGFVLAEDGSDYITVDVRREPGWNAESEQYEYSGNLSEGNTVGAGDIKGKNYYTSFIFVTQGGATSCPYEGEYAAKYLEDYNAYMLAKDSTFKAVKTGTVLSVATMQTEVPLIDAQNKTIVNVPSGEKAYFTLYLDNNSETQDDQWFDLLLVEDSNPDGAILSIDGTTISGQRLQYLVPAGSRLVKTLAVQKGRVLNYDNLKLALMSQCQSDPTGFQPVIADTVTLNVHFTPSCTDVVVEKPSNNWTYNTKCATDSVNGALKHYMPIVLGGFDVNYTDFDHIELQYKPSSGSDADWSTLMNYFNSDSLYQTCLANGMNAEMIKENTGGKINYNFFMDDLSDQRYDIRAVSVCNINNEEYENQSAVVSGIKDMYVPRLFGNPQPANGILTIEDDVRLNFNESIAEGLLTNNNFQVTGILNGTITDHDVAIKLDGNNEYLSTEVTRNLSGKSFTMEMFVKAEQAQNATIFSHGDLNDYIALNITSSNYLTVTVNGTVVTSGKAVQFDPGTWAHVALVYNGETNKVSAYYNFTEVISAATVSAYNGNGHFEVGRNVSTESGYYNGIVDNFRIWGNERSVVTIQSESNVQLSGNETSLLGYYPMDEGKGTQTEDKARSAHFTMNGGMWNLPSGYAFRTSGNTNSYIAIDASSAVATADMDYTLEFWFKAEPGQTNATMVSNGAGIGDAAGSLNLFAVGFDAAGKLYYANNDQIITIDSVWDDNNWHNFVLAVSRSAGNARIYMDGNLNTYTLSTNLGGISSDRLFIGARGWYENEGLRTYDQFFNGIVDELKLWNVYRRQSQIEAYNNEQLDGDELGLLAYYKFEMDTTSQGVNQRIASLRDAKVGSVALEAVAYGSVSPVTDNAPVKTKGAVSPLKYTFVTNNDALIINLTDEDYLIEKTIVTFTVKDVRDLNGNSILQPITWTAYIDRNQLKWDDDVINVSKQQYEPYSFTASFTNNGGSVQSYTLNNLPSWLSADQTSGNVNPLRSKEVQFTINEGLNVGSYNEVIYLTNDENVSEALELNVTVAGEEPDWDVDPNDYNYSMSVFGKLRIQNIFSNDASDLIGVFQNGKCVGKANCTYDKNLDMWYVMLTIYGNKVQSSGLSYRIWDASTNTTYEATPDVQFNFVNNSIVGTPGTPVIFDARETTYETLKLEKGWNWVSFNLANTTLSDINATLQEGSWTSTDIVKSLYYTSSYSAKQSKWSGALVVNGGFNNSEMYWIYSNVAQNIPVSGMEIQGLELTIKANSWNQISYTPMLNMNVETALAGYDAQEGDIIKGQDAFAMFYGNNWIGSLKYMEPLKGYMLRNTSATDKSLIYPKATSTTLMAPSQKTLLVNANDYSDNMTIVATCEALNEGDILSAYVDGVKCGQAEVVTVNGTNRLFITILGLTNNNAQQVLFVLNSKENEQSISSTVVPYYANSMVGTVDNPLAIEFDNLNQEISIYPVPYNQNVTVSGIVIEEKPVMIQFVDAMGRIVMQSESISVQQGGWFTKEFNTASLSQGVYLIKITQEGELVSTQVSIKE